MIKVRAWNKKTSSWIYWIVGEDCMCDLLVHGHIDKESVGLFTSLKDCEGKEIYANDQVSVKLANGSKENGTIEFIDGCFDIVFDIPVEIDLFYKHRDYLKCFTINHAVKIIGNLTENPELMEVKP